ncbi:DUF3800 domain-containing protein [Thioalkalivibrio sp. ALE23]|uniref:DUF3800 domain-containing protein n=1 Tax=Thioalkalivibrio sp. ALE23 TaxID=1265495 RepID=UPI002101AEDD|nr:DUF3800 domain-containing protein [Thioalkalivibrio sp. ALE23]
MQSLARDFKHYGHAWGKTYNYAEVPVFLDSRASRLIQLADLVAHAIYRHHERGTARCSTEFRTVSIRRDRRDTGITCVIDRALDRAGGCAPTR